MMQASVERERSASRAARGLCGGEGFRRDGCHQCVRLWVTFFSLESMAFSFAIRKEVLMLLLMASNLLRQEKTNVILKKIIPGQKKYLKLESGKNKFNSGF